MSRLDRFLFGCWGGGGVGEVEDGVDVDGGGEEGGGGGEFGADG